MPLKCQKCENLFSVPYASPALGLFHRCVNHANRNASAVLDAQKRQENCNSPLTVLEEQSAMPTGTNCGEATEACCLHFEAEEQEGAHVVGSSQKVARKEFHHKENQF